MEQWWVGSQQWPFLGNWFTYLAFDSPSLVPPATGHYRIIVCRCARLRIIVNTSWRPLGLVINEPSSCNFESETQGWCCYPCAVVRRPSFLLVESELQIHHVQVLCCWSEMKHVGSEVHPYPVFGQILFWFPCASAGGTEDGRKGLRQAEY